MPPIDDNTIVGFFDESSPQTTANTQRLLSFEKPVIYKNTTKYKANAFGFYTLNGTPVIDFKDHSKKEDVCDFFREIRLCNPEKQIVLIFKEYPAACCGDSQETVLRKAAYSACND